MLLLIAMYNIEGLTFLIGPKYLVPPLTGYIDHDITKPRAPAHIMAGRLPLPEDLKPITPGPHYEVTIYRDGPKGGPEWSLYHKLKPLVCTKTPGPNRYSPEKCPRKTQPPAFSLGYAKRPVKRQCTPGANAYKRPVSIGPDIPDRISAPAYTLYSRSIDHSMKYRSPGPAKYELTDIRLTKKMAPEYSMLFKPRKQKPEGKPGSNKYDVTRCDVKRRNPSYSFGIKHSPNKMRCMTSWDTSID